VTEGTIERRYAGPVEVGDGRTVVGLCVPFDRVATVADGDGGLPYQEVIRRGAFRKAMKAPNRVSLNREHRETLVDEFGYGVEFDESGDGLVGTFRVYDGNIGDHALSILRSGAITGLSISAALHPQGTRIVDGVVERRILILRHVALTSSPAYDGAEIMALRSGPEYGGIATALAMNEKLRARFTR